MRLWNYRPAGALLFMSNAFSRAGHRQVAETSGHCSRKSDAVEREVGVSPDVHAAAKAARPKWRTRLQRELLKIWLAFSALWVGCILAILGQCMYGRWFGWRLPQCDAPLVNPVETYIADTATAVGPPAAVLLMYRLVIWVSRRVRRSR
jgi:hypothetical protein